MDKLSPEVLGIIIGFLQLPQLKDFISVRRRIGFQEYHAQFGKEQVKNPFNQRQTFNACSRVCKSCRAIAVPLLYHAISIRFDQQCLRFLLRTLFMRPDLADRISLLELEGWITREIIIYDQKELKPCQDEDLLSNMIVLARDRDFLGESTEDWLQSIQAGLEAAETVILLHLARNLLLIDMTASYTPAKGFIWRYVNHVASRYLESRPTVDAIPPLSRVQRLYVSHWDTENGFPLATIAPYPQLPSMKSVCCFAVLDEEAEIEPSSFNWATSRGTSHVKSLIFERSLLSNAAIRAIVDACIGLRCFKLDHGDATVGAMQVDFDAIGHALRSQSQSLELLHLDASNSFDVESPGNYGDAWFRPLGTLNQFVKLREIRI